MNQIIANDKSKKKQVYVIPSHKQIACVEQLKSQPWREFMSELNSFGSDIGLEQYTATSRVWEYPWIWFHLRGYIDRQFKLLDIGTQRSPFPWFLAQNGFDVTISDATDYWMQQWESVSQLSGIKVDRKRLDAQYIKLPPASLDVYLSVSVLEHIPNKARTLMEAARVVKPGGLVILTFDVCQEGFGMKYPRKFDKAVTLEQIDQLIEGNPFFDQDCGQIPWNEVDIQEYLHWHLSTSHYHNYVTAACVLKRNNFQWKERRFRGVEVAVGIICSKLRYGTIETARNIWRYLKRKCIR